VEDEDDEEKKAARMKAELQKEVSHKKATLIYLGGVSSRRRSDY
jgi:hypothetical protein